MLASTTVCIVVIYFLFLFLYFFRPGWGGGGVIGPWDGRHFSRVTSGVRFCACGPCSVVMPRYQSGFVCGPLSAGLSC